MQLSVGRHPCGAVRRGAQPRAAGVKPVIVTRAPIYRQLVVLRARAFEPYDNPVKDIFDRMKLDIDRGDLDSHLARAYIQEVEEEFNRLMAEATESGSDEDVDVDELRGELAEAEARESEAQERAAALEATAAAAKEQFLRLTADFDNFRRRTREENAQLTDSVRGDVIKELLPLIDNFESARTQVKAETEAEQKINNSYQSLYKQMVDMMRSLGVEAVPTTGTPFDPNIHDAIMREPSTSHPDGTVLQEFRKGFVIGDKLLRPAMVKVSYTEDGPANSSEE